MQAESIIRCVLLYIVMHYIVPRIRDRNGTLQPHLQWMSLLSVE